MPPTSRFSITKLIVSQTTVTDVVLNSELTKIYIDCDYLLRNAHELRSKRRSIIQKNKKCICLNHLGGIVKKQQQHSAYK